MATPIRYLHNLTNTDKYFAGILFEANTVTQIPWQVYNKVVRLDSLITDITNGEVSVSPDGNNQYSNLNDKLEGLRGDLPSEVTIENNSSGILPVPTISSLACVEVSGTQISLPSVLGSYQTVYSYSGTGRLYNIVLDLDSDNIKVKLEIDSNTVFEIDCEFLDDMDISSGDHGDMGANRWIRWNDSKNILVFSPSYPIQFSSNITISAKANSTSTSRDVDGYIIELTKES